MSNEESLQGSGAARSKRRRGWFIKLLAVFQVLGFISAFDAVMSTRTEQGAIAWAIGLVAAPVVAVPAYWVFGRSHFQGYVEAFQENQGEFYRKQEQVAKAISESGAVYESDSPVWQALSGMSQMRMLRGNRAELLIDGEATFDSILDGIRNARKYVLVQFYIVHDDGLGNRLADALLERAAAGLMVALLYDEVGSKSLGARYLDRLKAGGVRVSPFNTTQGWRNKFQLNFRNHRKIVVVDGESAWIGGHNVGDEYLGLDEKYSPWRDTHVRIDGPMALQAQGVVVADWFWAQREFLPGLNWTPRAVEGSDVNAMSVATGPADPMETAGMFFVHALNSARERIWITAPYFVPDDAVVKALMLASLRGVDVRVLLPSMSDSLSTYLAAHHYVELLADSNVKFYRYDRGFLHQKVMLVDHHTSSIGTHNFDNRSFRLNFEIAAVIHDESFNSDVESMLLDDFEQSTLIDPESLADQPLYWRFGVKLARLLAPVL